ncbi:MAG: carboxymuconolactone decarboxylase family protein [Candidatus Omnitrophota bacterium]|nr:MAG: carboxymuconolactone decarboxylase family protein [Candidatus Omnitrophota bacterium]
MYYNPKGNLAEFNKLMVDIKNTIPKEYDAFINEKLTVTKSGKVPEKIKWLLLLVASLTQKCPVCIPRATQHCLEVGWSKEEMLEACMVGVLVAGSSVMTYVTLVDKTISEFKK